MRNNEEEAQQKPNEDHTSTLLNIDDLDIDFGIDIYDMHRYFSSTQHKRPDADPARFSKAKQKREAKTGWYVGNHEESKTATVEKRRSRGAGVKVERRGWSKFH
jgi:hypothetical protein